MAVRRNHRGGERAAVMLTLIQTAKLNEVDPQARLADVLAWIAITRPPTWPRCHGTGVDCADKRPDRGIAACHDGACCLAR
jgi:IS66 C-terminal element